MNKTKGRLVLLITLLCALSLSACDLLFIGAKLPVPTNLQIDETTLTWDAVENASGYFVQIDSETPVDNGQSTQYSLAELITPKTYKLKVMAKGDGEEHKDSDWSKTVDHIVEEEMPTEGLAYNLIDGNTAYEVSKGTADTSGEVIIPSSHNSKPVTSIGESAFNGCGSLTSITIPDSVTSIESGAFAYCSSLTSITIPDGVTSIGNGVFAFCSSLANVTMPSGIKSIGNYAFMDCIGLTDMEIPDGVASIGGSAFYNCSSLARIKIGDGVTTVNASAFSKTAWYNNQPDGIVYAGKILYSYKGTMPSNTVISDIRQDTVSIATGAFSEFIGLTGVIIPNSIINIGYRAFYNCSYLSNITVGDGVAVVGEGAFSATSWYDSQPDGIVYAGKVLYSYKGTMPPNTIISDIHQDTVSITSNAFSDCSNLINVTIPDSVTSIGDYAFRACDSLESIMLGSGVASIGDYAFRSCKSLTSITIPDSVTSIGNSAFDDCNSLISIDVDTANSHFSSKNGVLFNKSQTTLMRYPAGKTTTTYEIPDSVTRLSSDVFYYCNNLTNVIIPDNVISIGNAVFYGCSNLTSVTIGSGVASIGSYAFYGCSILTAYIESSSKPVGWDISWNSSSRPVVWGCILSTDKNCVVSFTKSSTSISNPSAANGINAPIREGYTFGGWATTSGGDTAYAAKDINSAPDGTTLYAIWTENV